MHNDKISGPTTWETVKNRFPVGFVVEGTVISHHPFGIFVDLGEPEAVGLVQITDFVDCGRMDFDTYPQVGRRITAIVLGHTDESRKQIWLGMRPSQLSRSS